MKCRSNIPSNEKELTLPGDIANAQGRLALCQAAYTQKTHTNMSLVIMLAATEAKRQEAKCVWPATPHT